MLSLSRVAASRRPGHGGGAAAAAARAEALTEQLPEDVHAQHPELRGQALSGRGAVELGAGRLDAAAAAFEAAIAAPGSQAGYEHADCLGYLALVEALRERLSCALTCAEQAAQATKDSDDLAEHITPAASVALASVHLQRGDVLRAHAQLKLAEAALRACPDKLVSTVACLVAAQRRLAEGRAAATLEMIRRARQHWSSSPPGWLDLRLTIVESRAHALAGDALAAVAAAHRAGPRSAPDAAAALAQARLAYGDHHAARRALDAVTGSPVGESQQLGLAGWLADARLSYSAGDEVRGRRSVERALQLAGPEQIRLPFAMERAWLRSVLRRDPQLARSYSDQLGRGLVNPAAAPAPKKEIALTSLLVERLSERERVVLIHLSGMLSTAEIAAEMYLSVNTVKTHLRSIYRKLSAANRSEAVRRARQLDLI